MSRISYSSFFSAALLVTIATLWIVFLPTQFGGAASYVIINGNSMEPLYYTGDLVITRREFSYGVGDIVTYFNKDLRRPVIHRIIAYKDGVFVLRGDHNTWTDDDLPSEKDIIGKAWLHLPSLGKWLAVIQTPAGITLLSAIAIFIVLHMYALRSRSSRARRKKLFAGLRMAHISITFDDGGALMKNIGRQLESLIFVFVILFAASLLLAYAAFTKPEFSSEPVDTEYSHQGTFSYSAAHKPGVYDADGPITGDPIFLKTTCEMTIRFDYVLGAANLSGVKGMISLRAETRDVNGWTRKFPLAAEQAFEGNTAQVKAPVKACKILNELRRAERQTELRRAMYNLVIIPEVTLNAQNGSQLVHSTFSPHLTFYIDDYQMYVVREDPQADPLTPFKSESQAQTDRAPVQIQMPGFAIPVGAARILAVIGILASLILGGYVLRNVYIAVREDPAVGIILRYGNMIVEVKEVSFDLRLKEIVVDSIGSLVKLAERNATTVMRLQRPTEDVFLVEGNSVVYRYSLPRKVPNVEA